MSFLYNEVKILKKIIFKYLIIIIIVLSIIGVYCYASTKQQVKREYIQEYTVENVGMKKLNTLRLSIVNIDTIDPIMSNNQNVQDIAKLIFDPLLQIDEEYKLQLALAKEWAKINDTQYIIKLKENITWHSGKKFTAKDIEYTINKIKENKETSIYYSNVENIQEVLIIDDSTIKIILDQEVAFFEYQLTFPIVSSLDYDTTNWIGTGRYQITEYTEKEIVMEKSKNYWNKTEYTEEFIEKINVYMYDSMGNTYQAFKDEKIDLLVTSNLDIESNIGSIGYESIQFLNRQYDYIACNMKHTILSKKEVRQSISYAINKKEIIEKAYQGKYKTANSPLDYASYLSVDITEEQYQPEKAKQILINAGWKEENGSWKFVQNGKNIKLQLNLTVCEQNEKRIQVAEMIKEQLKQIGIEINLRIIPLEKYNQEIQNKQYELLLAGMQTSFSPNLNNYLGEGNLANFQNDEIKSILSEIENIQEETTLKQKYKRIMEFIENEIPYIGLYFHTKTFMYQKNLKGNIQPNAYQIFYHIDTWYRED